MRWIELLDDPKIFIWVCAAIIALGVVSCATMPAKADRYAYCWGKALDKCHNRPARCVDEKNRHLP